MSEMEYKGPAYLNEVKVLLADNEPDSLEAMVFWARSIGWQCDSVRTAEAIIEAANNRSKDDSYDAIITDINYNQGIGGPRINGISAARAIRKAGISLPIVFVSGYSNSIIREEVRRVDAEIIPKPIDLSDVFYQVGQLIWWSRLAKVQKYDGKENRTNSINRTSYNRRASDKSIVVPKIVISIIQGVGK